MKHALVFLFLAACSKNAEPGSCYRARDNACAQYARSEAAAGKRMCTGFDWTAGEDSCPRANHLGICRKDGREETLYAGPPNQYTPEAAKSVCETSGGHFAAVPSR